MTDVKEQIKNDYLSGIPPKKLAGKYDISLNTIKSWIKRYGWSEIKKRGALSNTRGAPSDVSRKRKQGGQPGNKNAVGGGAPEQNKNAEKYGFFSKYLPDETREIFSAIEQADPLDLLWHQIQIAYEDKPIKLVVLDELTEFFDDGEGEDELSNIEATFVRGNKGGFQMIYLYNPPKNPNAQINQWCKKMEKRPDCVHIHTDYRDVPTAWLGPDLIASAKAMEVADPKMYRWVWLGESVGVDELIYYMFGERHRQTPDPDRRYDRIYIGGDYGQQNATTFQAFGLDTYRKKFPGLGEYYHSGRETGKQKSPSEYAQDLVEFMDELHEQYENRIFYIFLDPSAKGLAEEVRRATRTGLDYQVFLRDAENDVALGISQVQKALVFDIMSISPKQEYAVQEFGTYEYDKKSIEKGKEVPVKEADHCMDAIRYVVMGAWSKIKHWLPKDETPEEIDICDISSREVREEDEYL